MVEAPGTIETGATALDGVGVGDGDEGTVEGEL
jgi:hypothetical protein